MCVLERSKDLTFSIFFIALIGAISGQKGEIEDSCETRCDEPYIPALSCYCNDACSQFENCCNDYYSICNPEALIKTTWSSFNGHSYRVFEDNTITAGEAIVRCADEGGLLASINDEQEAEFVSSEVLPNKRAMSAFISGSDQDREGVWRWADGEGMPSPGSSWHLWYNDQPDNGKDEADEEDCSVMTSYRFWSIPRVSFTNYQFYWADFSCKSNAKDVQGYICERTLQCEPNPCQNNATCRYDPTSGEDREFACQCADNFYGIHCDMELVPGEKWTFCGKTMFTEQTGTLVSPLYPMDYPPRVDCTYQIKVTPGHTIALNIEHLDIEEGKDCIHDSLTIYDGGAPHSPILRGPLCGKRKFGNVIYSSSNEVSMRFTTDNSRQYSGYQISYTENECGRGSGDSGCGTRRHFTSTCGRILIRRGIDENNENHCEWLIQPTAGNFINLTFTTFNIPDTGMDCTGCGLAVYDGMNTSSSLLGRFCGKQFPWSIQSTCSSLYLKLEGEHWSKHIHLISIIYTSLDPQHWKVIGAIETENNPVGQISSDWAKPYLETSTDYIYKWLITGTIGNKLKLDWQIESWGENASLQIFDGSREDCRILKNLDELSNTSDTGSVVSTTYSLLVVVNRRKSDHKFKMIASYKETNWKPLLSGCYKPTYRDHSGSPDTENTIITELEPVVLTVSDQFLDEDIPVYNSGLYCKWHLKGETGSKLRVNIVAMNVFPPDQNCSIDGFVIYDGNSTTKTKHGPYCGASNIHLNFTSSEILVVFYSSTIPRPREGGTLRAIVRTSSVSKCQMDELGEIKAQTLNSSCGMVLSPNFPGRVPPDDWTWIIDTPEVDHGAYFTVYLYYVQGPAVIGGAGCSEFFKLFEVPRDSAELKHYETTLIRLCQDTDLFIPEATIKAPPYQKLGIDLRTSKSPLSQRWEFKLAYKTNVMPQPLSSVPQNASSDELHLCPEDEYYYKGHCYAMILWVLRHYAETRANYSFAKTWQGSLDYCEKRNGTLLTIKDEDEAYFIKHTLAHEWFWDPAGTFQTNHRMIFIGLRNKAGNYSWTDDTALAYSDWYWPSPSIYTPLLYQDTDSSTEDLLHTKIPQPTADSGSLCTAMIPLSPHSSLNWAKVPCDYPFQRTSAICKIPLPTPQKDSIRDEGKSTAVPIIQTTTSYLTCPKGWLRAEGHCLSMYTNYALINQTRSMGIDGGYVGLTYREAGRVCEGKGGHVLTYHSHLLPVLISLLSLWNHKMEAGHVWMASSDKNCSIIKVEKEHRLDTYIKYQHEYFTCPQDSDTSNHIYNVLCDSDPIEMHETCGIDEYQCKNEACVSVDSVCDGVDDCGDRSDEFNCRCGEEYFRCEDGTACIPVSLYCDFKNHCPDGSDEHYCVHEACGNDEFRCDNKQCIDSDKVCDFHIDCVDGSDETTETCEGHCLGFQCYSGRCLRRSLQHDLISDCPGLLREDETGDITRSKVCPLVSDDSHTGEVTPTNQPACTPSQDKQEDGLLGLVSDTTKAVNNDTSILGCLEGTAVQCRTGEVRCFDRSETCIYDTEQMSPINVEDIMQSCRNGFHLRTQCETIECPGMFHCPGSYCVPYNMICDGVRHCPLGEDEQHCNDYVCPGMLRCKGERNCVPRSKICDGEVNCKREGTDEKYCGVKDVACVSGCNCSGNVISCVNAGLTYLPEPEGDEARHLRALLLSGNQLNLTSRIFTRLTRLGRLDLSHNNLKVLEIDLFKDLNNLFDLDLSNNRIRALVKDTFTGLVSLQVLNLHGNMITKLRIDTFSKLIHLQHLIITENVLLDVSEDAFQGLTDLRVINTDSYKFCCIAKQADICTPEADEFSSCEDLMSNYALQVSIWVLGIVAFIGNAFVVVWRLNTDRSRISSFFIINLGVSDLLMGFYMLIIASVDVFYRGRYILYADSWRASALCKVAGVAAMISSEASVFMLTAITAERFISFVFPLKANNFRMKHACIIAFIGWIVVILLSVVPAMGLPYFGDSFFGRTGVCLPFHLSNEDTPGWEYSVFIFLCLNFVSFILIMIGYLTIFMVVSRSARGVRSTAALDEYTLAKKLALIVGTDLACWVPIALIGFAALGGAKIPPQVAAWVAVFVLPLNSAVNPLLYTFSALDFSKICCRKKAPSYSDSIGATSITSAGVPKGRL